MRITSATGPDSEIGLERQKQKLKKVCQDFESIMSTYLLKSMNEAVLRAEDEAFGSGRDVYEGMMVEAVASQLSQTQGLGLAKLLYEQLAPTLDGAKHGANHIVVGASLAQRTTAPGDHDGSSS